MRVLLSTTSGNGHFRPLLPLARALEAAGHEVACAAPAEAAAMVEGAGLRHLPFDGVPGDHPDRVAVMSALPTLPPHEAEHLMGKEVFGRLNTSFALPGARAALASFSPDLVVHEGAELAVRLAAEDRPVVTVNPCLSIRAYVESAAEGVADLHPGLAAEMLDGPWVSWFPQVFDLPDSPASVRRLRDPALGGQRAPELVYVTLGSEAHSLPFLGMVLRPLVAGALQSGLPVLVATGGEIDPGQLAGLEGDLTVERWVDQDAVLACAAVVVHHGGAGTTRGALAAGVPQVVVPLFADQPYNAGQVVAVDAGVRLAPGPQLEQDAADAVRALVADPPAGVAAMAGAVAALPTADEAVPWLESLV